MKKTISALLLLLFVQQLSAFTLYDQLCNFNFNWKKYEMRAPKGEARNFHSDKEYIQTHLENVLVILRSNPVDQLNAQQLKSRLHLIEVLDGYRIEGKFPMNYYRNYRTPVFIDENKRHCAVGYLLQQTGYEEMAKRISVNYQYNWLKDIHDLEFPAWQEASGFTMEELKLIQGGYFSYREDAFIAVDKYETPQKPRTLLVYFENKTLHKPMPAKPENVWLYGEGTNGVLNGKWIQNSSVGMPWIVGYYENGKRTGQWEEYFQGTKQLCRNENWRNDKLNGLRRRFDLYGNIIEEIMFKDGNAVKKTNYSLEDSLTYIRIPVDSNSVWTEVYNYQGSLIASGHETIYNPSNLQWFQNIPLTALNSASIRASSTPTPQSQNGNQEYVTSFRRQGLFNSTPLVQYKKEGDWMYFKEYNYAVKNNSPQLQNKLFINFPHFGQEIYNSISILGDVKINSAYDSIHIAYTNNYINEFYGFGNTDFIHFKIAYWPLDETYTISNFYNYLYGYNNEIERAPIIKEFGQYNKANEKIGVWKHFSKNSTLYMTEEYLVAWKEEEQ